MSYKIKFDINSQDVLNALKKLNSAAQTTIKGIGNAGKSLGGAFKNVAGSVFSLQGAITGLLAGAGLSKIVEFSIEQEKAVNRLNTALKSSGQFSLEASNDLQKFASSLQDVSTFGDEAILNSISLATSFGATTEQAKLVAQAAADLSAELGIDLESATRNVAKTLGGYAGELGETIPQLKELTKEQLQAGEGVRLLADRFKGAAQGELKTFGGAIKQAQNSFGDLLEEVGNILTKSPEAIGAINALAGTFKDLGGFVRENSQEFQSLARVGIIAFTDGVQLALKSISFLVEGLGNVKKASSGFQAFFQRIKTEGAVAFSKLKGDSEEVTKNIRKLGEAAEKNILFNKQTNAEIQAFTTASEQIDKLTAKFKESFENRTKIAVAEAKKQQKAEEDNAKKIGDTYKSTFDKLKGIAKSAGDFALKNLSSIGGGGVGAFSSIANQFGPIGQIVGFLGGQSKEQLDALIDSLIEGAQLFIENLIENIPGIIIKLAESLPVLIDELVAKAPEIIDALITSVPDLINSLIKLLPKVGIELALQMPYIATQFAISLVKNIPYIVYSLAEGIVDAIKELVNNAVGGIGDVFGSIGDFFGGIFHNGGKVGGAPNSNVPIIAQEGEYVINKDLTARLESLYQNETRRSNQTEVVRSDIYVNNKVFGEIILELNRSGARLA